MEIDVGRSENFDGAESGSQKIKSANRMRYEVEARFLRQQNGDLEQIRQRLGLSKRKICQLLLVDPSAWTRWTQPGTDAPPHIYKALDWYISILEKDPEYRRLSLRFAEWLNQEKEYSGRLALLEAKVQDQGTFKFESAPTQVATSKPEVKSWWIPALCFLAGLALALLFRH